MIGRKQEDENRLDENWAHGTRPTWLTNVVAKSKLEWDALSERSGLQIPGQINISWCNSISPTLSLPYGKTFLTFFLPYGNSVYKRLCRL